MAGRNTDPAAHATRVRHARNTHRTLTQRAVDAQDRMREARKRYGELSPAYRLAARRFKVAHQRVIAAGNRLERLEN